MKTKENSGINSEICDKELEAVTGGYDKKTLIQNVNKGTRIIHTPSRAIFQVEDCLGGAYDKVYIVKCVLKTNDAPDIRLLTDNNLLNGLISGDYVIV